MYTDNMAGAIPEIVDCDVLEAEKENCDRPTALTGRRVTALFALLATPHREAHVKMFAYQRRSLARRRGRLRPARGVLRAYQLDS